MNNLSWNGRLIILRFKNAGKCAIRGYHPQCELVIWLLEKLRHSEWNEDQIHINQNLRLQNLNDWHTLIARACMPMLMTLATCELLTSLDESESHLLTGKQMQHESNLHYDNKTQQMPKSHTQYTYLIHTVTHITQNSTTKNKQTKQRKTNQLITLHKQWRTYYSQWIQCRKRRRNKAIPWRPTDLWDIKTLVLSR
jgi:hypothetical protein